MKIFLNRMRSPRSLNSHSDACLISWRIIGNRSHHHYDVVSIKNAGHVLCVELQSCCLVVVTHCHANVRSNSPFVRYQLLDYLYGKINRDCERNPITTCD